MVTKVLQLRHGGDCDEQFNEKNGSIIFLVGFEDTGESNAVSC